MPAAVPIRADLSPADLRALARRERDGRVGARLHALAHARDGRGRTDDRGGGPDPPGGPGWTGRP